MESQWFAGHMARAKRVIREKLKLVDVLIELADARIPLSSRCPAIAGVLKVKPGLLVLNKADLADPEWTGQWVKWFRARGVTAIPCNAVTGQGVAEILREISRLASRKKKEKKAGKFSGRNDNLPSPGFRPPAGGLRFPTSNLRPPTSDPRPPTSMIVGIPNVGKSTLVNRLAGKRAARTGQLPGLTRGEQWIRIAGKLELLDTPGVLWPKLADREVALKLAVTGAIKEELFDAGEAAAWVLQWLLENKKSDLAGRFGLAEEFLEIEPLLEAIGRKRGFLAIGGVVDRRKTALHILKEFQSGKLGRHTLEYPVNTGDRG
ncbi:MAG: ribosome biogenesis GTPase YlqF [Armatimonadetes bacterium]|nr:ribosome biogenesis GTPase YlqF [Armatimonadota bacterium]